MKDKIAWERKMKKKIARLKELQRFSKMSTQGITERQKRTAETKKKNGTDGQFARRKWSL